jgi:hypothetical protein
VADRLKKYGAGGGSALEYAFDTLAAIRVGEHTERMTVYDLKKMDIHYKTLRYPKVKTIRLADCDFDPRTGVQVIITNTAREGLLNPYLHHYEVDLNRWLVYYSFRHIDGGNIIPDEVLKMLAEHGEAPGMYYLSNWEVAGPYAQKQRSCTELFDIPFGPEKSAAKAEWRSVPTKSSGKHLAYVDLSEHLNDGEQSVAYLRTRDECPAEMAANLEIYSDDGVKVWLNGKVIHENNVMRGIASQPDIVGVTLKEGTNDLMLKVTQNDGPWGAIVRVQPFNGRRP